MAKMQLRQQEAPPPAVAHDPRWDRVLARDKAADGQFWYSVSTTGIYCRPSCPSRTANPKNVQLHDTLEDAKATGFRPCKRCNPDGLSVEGENAALVAKACRLIEQSEEEPSLNELADSVGRSASYFHRIFKAATGLTPKDYATAHRAAKVRQGLESRSVLGLRRDRLPRAPLLDAATARSPFLPGNTMRFADTFIAPSDMATT
jgi:AraC family transcriptional regulator, regulatory protein of adaptative response / methylated-DNA-[protein]-cysteine methyltransferase